MGDQVNYQTPFEKLPADLQKQFVEQQKILDEQDKLYEQIHQHSYSKVKEMRSKMESVNDALNGVKDAITDDLKRVNEFMDFCVRKQKKEADKQLQIASRCGNNSQVPPHEIPSPFFWSLVAEFENRMQMYRHQIDDIESALRTPNTPSNEASVIGETIITNNEIFLSIGAKVAELHHRLQKVKQELVRQIGDDPFKKRKESKKTSSSIPEEIMLPPVVNTPNSNTGGTPSMFGSTNNTASGTTPATPFGATPFGFSGTNTSGTTGNMFGTSSNSSSLFGSNSGTTAFGATNTGTSNIFGAPTTPLSGGPPAKKSGSGSFFRNST